MKGRKLEEKSAVRSLARKNCAFKGKEINVTGSRNMGNSSWGLVDFLVNHLKYTMVGLMPEKEVTIKKSGKYAISFSA